MRYQDWLVPELRNLEDRKEFLRSAPDRIMELEERVGSIQATRPDKISIVPGAVDPDGAIINAIAERDTLRRSLDVIRQDVQWLEDGLAKLTTRERMVLERFYVFRSRDSVARLMEDLHVEQSQVYRLKDAALRRLARILVGLTEV